MKTIACIYTLLVTTLVAGAEEPTWQTFRGNPELTGVAEGATTSVVYRLKWRFDTGGDIKSSPVVGPRFVFVGSDSGAVHALDRVSGEPGWKASFTNAVEAPPVIAGDMVVVGTLGGEVVSLQSMDGIEAWRFKTGGKVTGAANVVNDRRGRPELIVVGSYDFNMYGLNPKSGEKQWQFAADNFINGTPSLAREGVAFAGCDAMLRVLRPKDGLQQREIDVGAYVAGSVAVVGDLAFVANYEGAVYGVDLRRGKVAWRYQDKANPSQFVASPAVNDELVVVGDSDGRLHALRRQNGRLRWMFRARDALDSSPVIAGNHVFVGSSDGRVYCLDITNGRKRWSYDIGAAITASVAVVGDWLYVGAEDGVLYAFQAK